MRKLSQLFGLLVLVSVMTACPKGDDPAVVPPVVDTTPEYQKAIDAKYKALGWDKDGHVPFNGSAPVKTTGGTGYVQYYAYGGGKSAIYYFAEKGAFGMNGSEMNTYDAAGQDNWAIVSSDPQSCGTGCGFNDVILKADKTEGIVILNYKLSGEIYTKYKAVKRWEGPLGIPSMNESNLTSNKGKYVMFTQGQIYYSSATGAQAFWGKIDKLYKAAGYDTGWLALPTTSCDVNLTEGKQYVRFQNGAIDGAACGNYYALGGLLRYQNGSTPPTGSVPPCY